MAMCFFLSTIQNTLRSTWAVDVFHHARQYLGQAIYIIIILYEISGHTIV